MPHMGGAEAFQAMRDIDRDVRVVLCSGYSEADIEQQFFGKGLAGFLQKPFNTRDLQKALDDALERQGD